MSQKVQYRTKHQEELIGYLESVQGKHITVGEICDYFHSMGKTIGTATVYRQMERLVEKGLVNKYIIDSNTPACFEYIGRQEECCEGVCFHCKCEKCGQLIHLHCEELEEIQKHLMKEHSFRLDPLRTVFYGICESCRAEEAGGKSGGNDV